MKGWSSCTVFSTNGGGSGELGGERGGGSRRGKLTLNSASSRRCARSAACACSW